MKVFNYQSVFVCLFAFLLLLCISDYTCCEMYTYMDSEFVFSYTIILEARVST